MKSTVILILIIIIIIIVVYINYYNNDFVYVVSDIDNKKYLVKNTNDKQMAANILAKIKENIMTITNYLYEKKDLYKDYINYILQLHKRIQNVIVLEGANDGYYTSYSINKGEQIVFCLRSRKIKDQIHKLNLLMYVVLHEISHVACPEYGHTELFKNIFAFITSIAIEIQIYEKIDFAKQPVEYCGLNITDSII